MGWLKKHLNPNPVKQIKNTVQDTKDSIKKPMAMMAGKKKVAPTTGGTTSRAAGSGGKFTTGGTTSRIATSIISGKKAPVSATGKKFTTGRGLAPAPRAYTPKAVSPIPATSGIRKTAARKSLSTLGTGKYRIK